MSHSISTQMQTNCDVILWIFFFFSFLFASNTIIRFGFRFGIYFKCVHYVSSIYFLCVDSVSSRSVECFCVFFIFFCWARSFFFFYFIWNSSSVVVQIAISTSPADDGILSSSSYTFYPSLTWFSFPFFFFLSFKKPEMNVVVPDTQPITINHKWTISFGLRLSPGFAYPSICQMMKWRTWRLKKKCRNPSS